MNKPECFSCDKRQLCESIIGETVVGLILSNFNDDAATTVQGINPMDMMSLFRVLDETAVTGDGTAVKEFVARDDFVETSTLNLRPAETGYSKLRATGCTLGTEEFNVRLAQHLSGNMLAIIGKVLEEEMVQEFDREIGQNEDERLEDALITANAEIADIFREMRDFTADDPETQNVVDGFMAELGKILRETDEILGDSDVTDLFTTQPLPRDRELVKSLDELKSEERARYVAANGWDSESLNFAQELELKAHLRQKGLIR